MRLKRHRPAPAQPQPPTPAWQELIDSQERPTREQLNSQHSFFVDGLLEPVPLPRWLRGRRRPEQDKLTD